MKKGSIILCILLLLCFTACDNAEEHLEKDSGDYYESADKNSESGKQDDAYIDIGMAVYDKDKNIIDTYKDDTLIYNGEPFEFYVRVENYAEFPVTVCLSALMQSNLQPFMLEGTDEEVMSSTVVLKGKEYHDFHMYITPVVSYADRDTLLQYMLYTTKGIDEVKTKSMLASTYATMSQLAIKSGDVSNEIYPKNPDMAKAEIKEQVAKSENSLAVVARINDKWEQPPVNLNMSENQNVYICVSGGSKNDSDVTKYMVLSYVDGKLVKGFGGKYQGIFEKEEGVLNYFAVDNDVIHLTGEHLISTVLIPIEYKDENKHDKLKLLEQNRYWIVLGNEGIFNFQ